VSSEASTLNATALAGSRSSGVRVVDQLAHQIDDVVLRARVAQQRQQRAGRIVEQIAGGGVARRRVKVLQHAQRLGAHVVEARAGVGSSLSSWRFERAKRCSPSCWCARNASTDSNDVASTARLRFVIAADETSAIDIVADELSAKSTPSYWRACSGVCERARGTFVVVARRIASVARLAHLGDDAVAVQRVALLLARHALVCATQRTMHHRHQSAHRRDWRRR
jgi:hypothetical protein